MSIISRLDSLGYMNKGHAAGAFSSKTLQNVENVLPVSFQRSAETGCGKSTILFSNLSSSHTVFTLDDTDLRENSSVLYYKQCPITKLDVIETVYGPTQFTLPVYNHKEKYDVVLIDGPHGYPFPELEYYYFYPNIREGGILIIDDVHIPTIGRLGDFIREDDMFDMIGLFDYTAVFRRTSAPSFDKSGDGWWLQKYNLRRTPKWHEMHLDDDQRQQSFLDMFST
jgi:hypothetical protein